MSEVYAALNNHCRSPIITRVAPRSTIPSMGRYSVGIGQLVSRATSRRIRGIRGRYWCVTSLITCSNRVTLGAEPAWVWRTASIRRRCRTSCPGSSSCSDDPFRRVPSRRCSWMIGRHGCSGHFSRPGHLCLPIGGQKHWRLSLRMWLIMRMCAARIGVRRGADLEPD